MRKRVYWLINLTWLVIILSAVLIATNSYFSAHRTDGLYPKTGIVNFVNRIDDIMVIEDVNGDEWEYEGVNGFREGDLISMIMFDNNTIDRLDDIIMSIKFESILE